MNVKNVITMPSAFKENASARRATPAMGSIADVSICTLFVITFSLSMINN